MPRVPEPNSIHARQALITIGHYWRTGGNKRLFGPEVKAAYRKWGQITGTHHRPGHRSGLALLAERFARRSPPPSPLSIEFDAFYAKRTGKAWKVPFIRQPHDLFAVDFTLVKAKPHFRIRFPSLLKGGRPPAKLKLAAKEFLHSAGVDVPKGRSLSAWSKAPSALLETSHPFVSTFLAALVDQ